jgi:hypothetical protein
MSVYTVHQPPPRDAEAFADPQRFVFVRDGFYVWAFLLGPAWMLFRRLWLAAALYLAALTLAETGLWALRVSAYAQFAFGLVVALLVGLEAGSLWRWTLDRRGWKNIGVVVGDDLESAERRFFAAWVAPRAKPAMPPLAPAPAMGKPASGAPEVIGLFPEPGRQK